MTSTKPITSPIGQAETEITGATLSSALLDLIDLSLFGKQAHWTVVGEHFRTVHLQLDELVDTARNYADEVAERAAAIGVPVDGRAQTVASGSGVENLDADWHQDRAVIEAVVAALTSVIDRMRARIEETEKSDQVTQDLFIEIARELEKARWMWQAQLAG
ncbi:Dps family protein [Sciscionella marina]|uniref:Dps family protein n=1 Tax=Sciscionella marina TaxID=508770 RepID=UPI00037BE0F5|nr:DNA starvation/stationary phase protection protein [Sciscionella marina]